MSGQETHMHRLLGDLCRRAPFYTPEWRYNPHDPDPGTAIAMTWAELHAETEARYARAAGHIRMALLEKLGGEALGGAPACGYLAFTPSEGLREPVSVPAGVGAACPEVPEAVLVTTAPLTVPPTSVAALYEVRPEAGLCAALPRGAPGRLFALHGAGEAVWTLRHPFAFDVSPGGLLRLRVADAAALCGDNTRWEAGDAAGFRPVTARAEGESLLLRLPAERDDPCRALRLTCPAVWDTRAALRGLTALPSESGLPPDAVFVGDAEREPDDFPPFGESPLPGQCLLLSCPAALDKPGAAVELSFTLRFERVPLERLSIPAPPRRFLLRAEEVRPPAEYELAVSEVAWEYYNGAGWATLPGAAEHRRTFSRADRAGRHTVRFFCPEDMAPFLLGGRQAATLRVRVLGVEHLGRPHGHYLVPHIERPRFRYGYSGGVELAQAEVEAYLERRTVPLTPRGVEPPGDLPPCPALYLAFDRPFSEGTLLFWLAADRAAPPLRWEYRAADGWREAEVQGGAASLGQTGVVSYRTGPPCRAALFGREGYWMRLLDTEKYYVNHSAPRPELLGLWENAVPAAARLPGRAGNLAAGMYRVPTTSIPGIRGVSNPLPAAGGCDGEEECEMLSRITAELSHRSRAVSRADYEALAREVSPDILRCKCHTGTDLSGAAAEGAVCLVVLLRGGRMQWDEFSALRRRICAHITARRPLAFRGHLFVTQPRFVAVQVALSGETDAEPPAVRARLEQALSRFLDPLTGGADGRGWDIGTLPDPSRVGRLLRGVAGVDRLRTVEVSYLRQSDGAVCDYATAARDPFALPVPGRCACSLTRGMGGVPDAG